MKVSKGDTRSSCKGYVYGTLAFKPSRPCIKPSQYLEDNHNVGDLRDLGMGLHEL